MRRALAAVAGRRLGVLLDAQPPGGPIERSLLRLGHLAPYALPGLGVIIEQLAARHDGRPLIATLSDGLRLSVPAAIDGWNLYLRGRLEREDEGLTHLLRRFLRDGDVCFDVGANLGYYACTAARACGSSGQVHAFEPQARLVAHIHESLRLNGFDGPSGSRVCHAAVSAQHGGHLSVFLAQDQMRLANVPSLFRHPWLAGGTSEEVPAISLDGYVRDRGIARVDLVKIDVEGAELMVLDGLRDTLTHHPPDALVVEVMPEQLHFAEPPAESHVGEIGSKTTLRPHPESRCTSEIVALLAEHGYAPRHITPQGWMGGRFTLDEMMRVAVPANVLFVRPNIETRRPGIVAGHTRAQ